MRRAVYFLVAVLTFTPPACGAHNDEEITFNSGTEILAGTLMIPRGEGPFPAIVFAHYSGKQTREAGNYRRLAKFVANRGVAAFIYDRRGRGESTGDPHRFVPFDILAGDALAALRAIRKHPSIRSDQIGVGGASQAGWVCPLAASRGADVAFVVVISAAGVTPDEQELFVQEEQLRRQGKSQEEIAASMASLRGMTPEARVTSFAPSEKERNLPFFLFDPLPAWRQVDVPVLAIWGSEDELMPVESSHASIRQALQDGRNPPVTFRIYDGAGHDLEDAPEFKRLIVDWILGL